MTEAELKDIEQRAAKATPIEGWPGYSIDTDGNVFSNETRWRGKGVRILEPHPNSVMGDE